MNLLSLNIFGFCPLRQVGLISRAGDSISSKDGGRQMGVAQRGGLESYPSFTTLSSMDGEHLSSSLS